MCQGESLLLGRLDTTCISHRCLFTSSRRLLWTITVSLCLPPAPPPGIFVYEKGVWEAIKQQVAEKGATQFYGALLRCAYFSGGSKR